MTEKAQHTDSKDKGSFGKGKKEAPRHAAPKSVKDTAKTREAKRSKGGRESTR